MYFSKLQRFILKHSLNNINNENLTLDSDGIEKFTPKKEDNIDLINSTIDDLLHIKKKSEENIKNEFRTKFGYIEPDSNSNAHIYFYEPIIYFFGIKPKEKFIKQNSSMLENSSEIRKNFEIKKRKYIREDGNHKRGVIRGECKYLKRSKASLSRSFSTLIGKKLIRKISLVDYDNKEIGIGFNLTKKGKKIINEI